MCCPLIDLRYGKILVRVQGKLPFDMRPTAVNLGRTAVNIVPPVHHTVRFRKSQLMTRFPGVLQPKSHVQSAGFQPQKTSHDRVHQHYLDTVQEDMLLINYDHGSKRVPGNKPMVRKGETPYQLYQPNRPPIGRTQATKDIKVRDWRNIPQLNSIVLNCFVKPASLNHDLAIAAKLQLQQITGQKPKNIFARTNVPAWTLRPGMPMGSKVTLTGQAMNQFLSTLTELVLPRSKTFRGISNTAGDSNGNIVFSLTPDDLRLFPEIEGNLELWPQSFGVDVFFRTSAQTDREARTLLSAFGLPFQGTEKFTRW